MAAELHISISAERVADLGPLTLTNSIITSLIVSAILIGLFFAIKKSTKQGAMKRPKPLQNIAEMLVDGIYGVVQGITGDHKKTRFFTPFFLSFFLFILFNNWFGLIPGVGSIGFMETEEGTQHAMLLQKEIQAPVAEVQAAEVEPHEDVLMLEETDHGMAAETEEVEVASDEHPAEEHSGGIFVPYLRAGTADLNTTLALAVFTMLMVQVIGVKYQGFAYFKKFFNLSNPIMFFVSILETISEFAKIISFSFRLFGNIFAGEVLLIVIGSLIPLIAPMPFYGLELFVGLIQALVFAMLSVVFYNTATVSHDEH